VTYRLGFDIGGTFTDVLLVETDTGAIVREKVATTPSAFAEGALAGVDRALETAGIGPGEVDHVAHGTTVATNALLERDGATTGLITTEGFRDVLAIGREKRSEIYDLAPEAPPTFVDRAHRHGVRERTAADGTEIEPLDEADAAAAVDALADAGVESVAVALLHAYADDGHERRVAELAADRGLSVARSAAVLGEIKEYERTLSTVLTAYVGPIVDGYVDALSAGLADRGIEPTLHLMAATGGLVTPETLAGRQLRLVNSGPAAGVLGAARLTAASGAADVITLDMGGTSTDVGLVDGGEVETTTEGDVEGTPLLFSQIDVRAIGAGGGSIARTDRGGTLKVGPESAGARPGPACYGRGGEAPTVTDAALHLGHLDPDYFLGGEMRLDEAAAEAAIERLADRVGMGTTELADGIVEIMAADMTRGIRLVTVENGHDPRSFVLAAFGGAGPLFAGRLAADLDIDRTIVPRAPGVLSTIGLATADRRYDFSVSDPTRLDPDDAGTVAAAYDDLEARARETAGPDATLRRRADVRYLGQTFDLTVDVPGSPVDAGTVAAIRDRFRDRYRSIYGHASESDPIEAVTWRLEAVAETPGIELAAPETGATVADARKGRREAYADGAFREHDVYERAGLPAGETLSGPAIVEEPESTTLIAPDATFRVDRVGNLLIDR